MNAIKKELAAGEVLRIEHARDVHVAVQSGLAWITEEARNDDVWLRAGEETWLQQDGLAVVEAIGPTKVSFW